MQTGFAGLYDNTNVGGYFKQTISSHIFRLLMTCRIQPLLLPHSHPNNNMVIGEICIDIQLQLTKYL